MEKLKKWLVKSGYIAEDVTLHNHDGKGGAIKAIRVDTDYFGPYPGAEQFDALSIIRKHARECSAGLAVKSCGAYTSILIF